jgi:enoyl-CoA hydratase/carnithine racemase
MTVEYTTIETERTPDHVLTVTLNRPERLNAFNEAMAEEFARLWLEIREDPSVHAVVLRSNGGRAFSTGVDVTERLAGESPFLDRVRPWDEIEDPGRWLSPKRNEVWKPVVAAVEGMCAGGAAYWISECDIVICEPGATFFDPHVTFGLVAALEPIALSYRMRLGDVLRMTLLGSHERMTAQTALQSGLVSEVVPATDLRQRAHELAALIASQPPVAVQGSVKAIWQSLNSNREQALSTALMYTQIGNPIATEHLDRRAAKPASFHLR